MTDMREAFAQALRQLRKARGLTQEDFSLVSSRTHLSSLERGQKSPTLDKVHALARILDTHPLTLLAVAYSNLETNGDPGPLMAQILSELAMLRHSDRTIRLLIADDHAIVREGLKQLFALVEGIAVVGEAEDGEQALRRLKDGGVDLLLLDLSMPGVSGADLIRRIRNSHPAVPILVLSMHIEPQVAQGALDAGALGYVIKDQAPETLLAAIRGVAIGDHFVDPRLAKDISLAHRLSVPH